MIFLRFSMLSVTSIITALPVSSERISRSEDGIVRWEISAGSRELCDKYNAMIRAVTDKYVVLNSAHYC